MNATHLAVRRDRELKWVPVAKIIKNERNPREKEAFTRDELKSLRSSIETHGILEPLIVQPYDDDMYLLIEGERRWTVAQELETKEIPVIVVNRMDEHDQVVVMFNVHTQRRGWEKAEELRAIKELRERNGNLTDDDLARELGISPATLRDRLQVLVVSEEDPDIIPAIAKDELDYSSVLRADSAARTISRRRPELAEKLGGPTGIRKKLLTKAKSGKRGISQELVEASKDLRDPDALSDDLVEEYITKPDIRIGEIRRRTTSLKEQRQIEDLTREVQRLDRQLTLFHMEFEAAPNLREFRVALATLIVTAQGLERRVSEALHKQKGSGR